VGVIPHCCRKWWRSFDKKRSGARQEDQIGIHSARDRVAGKGSGRLLCVGQKKREEVRTRIGSRWPLMLLVGMKIERTRKGDLDLLKSPIRYKTATTGIPGGA